MGWLTWRERYWASPGAFGAATGGIDPMSYHSSTGQCRVVYSVVGATPEEVTRRLDLLVPPEATFVDGHPPRRIIHPELGECWTGEQVLTVPREWMAS